MLATVSTKHFVYIFLLRPGNLISRHAFSYLEIIPQVLALRSKFVNVHMVNVEWLATVGQNFLFTITFSGVTFALSVLATFSGIFRVKSTDIIKTGADYDRESRCLTCRRG